MRSSSWNVGDNSVPWVNDLQAELRTLNPAPPGGTGRAAITSPQFEPVEEAEFRFVHVTNVDGLVGMIGTWSPVIVNPERGRLLDQLHEFLASHPDLGDGSRIEVPYRTRVLRLRKEDGPW